MARGFLKLERDQGPCADLQPLDENTLVLDLDSDPLPRGPWDTITLLGVLEYLYHPAHALKKIAAAASHLVFSYCCCINKSDVSISERHRSGWINAMTEQNIRDEMSALGFHLSGRELFNSTTYFEQIVFEFTR